MPSLSFSALMSSSGNQLRSRRRSTGNFDPSHLASITEERRQASASYSDAEPTGRCHGRKSQSSLRHVSPASAPTTAGHGGGLSNALIGQSHLFQQAHRPPKAKRACRMGLTPPPV